MVPIEVTLLGGAHEVGRSSYLVEHKGESVALDHGLQLTEPVTFPIKPERINSLILSHAHLDHSGGIPYLHKKKPFGIYGVDITFDICQMLLHDSVKVNRIKNLPEAYSDGDVDRIEGSEITIPYGRERKIGSQFTVTMYDAGHIPGSAGILLDTDEKKIFYSGDTNAKDTMLLKGATYPQADVLISESTYGDMIHPDREQVKGAFLDKVEETCDRGGVAIVPAFAVGRSQEILMTLDSIPYPIYLDGMSKAVVKVFLSYSEYLRDADLLQKSANNANWVYHNQMRKEAVKEPCVIVTTAGMLTGGPVLSYLSKVRKDSRSTVLLVGYQVEGTNGRTLIEEGYITDQKTGKKLAVKCEVDFFDFSAHSDQKTLIEMADKVKPQEIILVHGEDGSRIALAEKLSDKYKVHTPENGDKITLQ
ncbi:MAG: MBL fold metallo-hydrolase [Candidatus Altiarchaeota archaeon]